MDDMARGAGALTLTVTEPSTTAEAAKPRRRKMPEVDFKLYPSKFAFLWDDCPRCYWLDLHGKLKRPDHPMPKVFGTIDAGMKSFLLGKRTEEVCPEMPPGEFISGELYVCSRPYRRSSTRFVLCGKPDGLVRFDDGSYGVVDFKTSGMEPHQLVKYARQLETYARALENPAPDYPHFAPISKIGLVVFRPDQMNGDDHGLALRGKIEWFEIPRKSWQFDSFLRNVVDTLADTAEPAADPNCVFCKYRAAA